jgi:hypothetical protein
MIRFVLVLACAAALARAEAPADYASGVGVTAGGGKPFYRLELPAAVYEGVAHRDLADVRVFNAEGDVVPFAWLPRPASVREKPPAIVLPQFPLYVERGGDVAALTFDVVRSGATTSISVATREGGSGDQVLSGYVLDATGVDKPLTALVFALPEGGAPTMHLRIDASDDLLAWRSVVTDGMLVDLVYAGRRLIRDRIEFAPTKASYFRVSWAAGRPAMALSMIRAERGGRTVEPPRQWREAAGTLVTGASGDYEFDLGGPFPVDRVALELTELNSVVPAQLSARGAPTEPWRPLAATVFYRLRDPGGEVASAPLVIAGGGQRYWLLRVDPRSGGVGRNAPRLAFGWQPQELAFAARGPAPFVLAYGSRSAISGALPLATLVPGYDPAKGPGDNVGVARLGAPIPLGGMQRLVAPIDTRRWILWGTLVLGALALGWMAWRLTREMSVAKPPQGAQPPRREPREAAFGEEDTSAAEAASETPKPED